MRQALGKGMVEIMGEAKRERLLQRAENVLFARAIGERAPDTPEWPTGPVIVDGKTCTCSLQCRMAAGVPTWLDVQALGLPLRG